VLLGGVLLSRALVSRQPNLGAIRFIPLANENVDEVEPAWSADGRSLAYAARVDDVFQIFTRTLESPGAARITSSTLDCSQPFWSPDGTRIYYASGRQLWVVGASGGTPRVLVPGITTRTGFPTATISPDGATIAFFRPEGAQSVLSTVAASGGRGRRFTPAPFPPSVRLPPRCAVFS
jgi:Tol biopolymer transport system component